MTLSAAYALVPQLYYRQRYLEAEQTALVQIATWASQFTPNIALKSPRGLLLEISASLKLFGGIESILESIKRGITEMGFTAASACAPTAMAAWFLINAGKEKVVTKTTEIETEISSLPVTVLDGDEQTFETLAAIGAKTLADVLRLPREGLAKRFGPQLLNQLDQALAKKVEVHSFYTAPPSFESEVELAVPVMSAEVLLFAIKRLLKQFVGYLAAGYAGMQRFQFMLLHEDSPATVLEIGFSTPAREFDRLFVVVRERLSSMTLAAPVYRVRLQAKEILTLVEETRHLFSDRTSDAGEWHKFLERLRARLGSEAVYGLQPRAEHRPELAWEKKSPGDRSNKDVFYPNPMRPLWLLPQPQPLKEEATRLYYQNQPLSLIAGPERIESGWWDGADVKRDYFIARTPHEALLWIYRDRQWPGAWYLHGIFG